LFNNIFCSVILALFVSRLYGVDLSDKKYKVKQKTMGNFTATHCTF